MSELQLILIVVTAGFVLLFLTLCCVCIAISRKIKKNSFNVNISVKDLEKAGLLNGGVQYVYAPAPNTASNEVVATVLEDEDDDDDEENSAVSVVKKFPVIPKKTHTEKYNELPVDAKGFYDEIMQVARELEKVSNKTTNTAELVKVGSNKVVVARIKNNKICLYFETMSKEYEEFMKINFDKKAFTDKPLELKISNADDKDKAKEVIIIAYQRVLESRKLARKLAREKRKAKAE